MATHRSFGELANRMNFIGKEIRKNATKLVREVAITVHNTLVFGTPVDTGRARMAWFVSLRSPVLTNPDAPARGSASPEVRGFRASQSAFEQGQPVILGWQIGAGDIYISNGVPYIETLDKGSSKQAPNGFTKKALMAGRRVTKSVKILPPGTG